MAWGLAILSMFVVSACVSFFRPSRTTPLAPSWPPWRHHHQPHHHHAAFELFRHPALALRELLRHLAKGLRRPRPWDEIARNVWILLGFTALFFSVTSPGSTARTSCHEKRPYDVCLLVVIILLAALLGAGTATPLLPGCRSGSGQDFRRGLRPFEGIQDYTVRIQAKVSIPDFRVPTLPARSISSSPTASTWRRRVSPPCHGGRRFLIRPASGRRRTHRLAGCRGRRWRSGGRVPRGAPGREGEGPVLPGLGWRESEADPPGGKHFGPGGEGPGPDPLCPGPAGE